MRPKLFNAESKSPFILSRSKLELYFSCKRCFYLDRKLGVSRPSGFPFNLNIAVDTLLKKEFDIYRQKQAPHPLLTENNLAHIVPFTHEKLSDWRDNFKGLQRLHEGSNIILSGAVDDIWYDTLTGELIVADYKATSKPGDVDINAKWQDSYKRQIEVYSWLLAGQHFYVSPVSFFVYCNALTSAKKFDGELKFQTALLSYTTECSWLDVVLPEVRKVLESTETPEHTPDCEYCTFALKSSC